jgi:integrase/recombinase XerD
MVHFIRAMKDAGLGDRTQNNLFGAIVTFLHAQDHPVVTRKDAPDYTETEIETYSAEELGQLFGACTAAERLVFQFFLGTGWRSSESFGLNPIPGLALTVKVPAVRSTSFHVANITSRSRPAPPTERQKPRPWRRRDNCSY